tara:strand:- start:4183 stop:5211 length:1029 start_codon:yes stop_codon:yes gene_type:complete
MAGIIFGLSAGALMAISGGASLAAGGVGKLVASNKQKRAEREEARAQKKLEAFERGRQAVIDQSGAIRDLKKQVYNPYANLAVATQAADLQIEQTDQALANTLDQINQSGTGAGAATAMARMAAASKAQVSASLENQEVQNNKLRAEGQAQADASKMQLEQAALSEEIAAYGRQEDRDLASLDRLSGLQENAQAQAMAYAQQGNEALMGGIEGALGSLGGMASLGGSGAGTSHLGSLGSGSTPGLTGSGSILSTGTVGGVGSGIPLGSLSGSDRRLKQNITQVGKSASGLNIYTFEYKDKSFGEGLWQGVMSDEIPEIAVIKGNDGYDRVDYSKLDVTFKKI